MQKYKIIQVPVPLELWQRLQNEAEAQNQSLASYSRLILTNTKVRVTYEQPLPTLN